MAAITLEDLLEEVDVNPEKLNDSISDHHLREIALFLTSWKTIAPHLDLDENDLDDAEQGGRKVKDKSLKALQIWKGKFGFRATYRKLVEVLLSLAMADVAEKICNLLKESIPIHESAQSKLREHEASDARSGSDVNTGLTDVLRKQPEFQQLSISEQEELMVTLYDDEKSMRRQFGKLVVKTCDSIEERVPVVKFARSILALGAYDPAPGKRDPALLDEHSEEVRRAGSISEIFNILSTYWSYLTYEILEDIIELYGTSDDTERLRNYNKELYKFCKRRSFELPPESSNGNTLSPKQERFLVKLNVREDITCEQLLQIRGRIAKILKINLAALVLSRVDKGCVQLLFLIPKFVAREIFPLSQEQTSAFSKDVSVIRLECRDYLFEAVVTHNTVLEGIEDKIQPQTEPCAERQVQTSQTNTEPQTTEEGQLFTSVRPDEATEPPATSEKLEAGALLQKQYQKETKSSDDSQQAELILPSPDSRQSADTATAMHSNFTPYERMLENRNIIEQITCAVCLGPYQDPRILRCCHSFCRKCLVGMVKKRLWDPLEKNEVQCPLCCVMTNIGVGGVEELPVNELLCKDPVMKPFSHLPVVPPRFPVPSVIYEDLPGVPLNPIPLNQAGDAFKRGAHLLYQVCKEPYRPCYRSALVLKVEDKRIHVIMNSSDGVKNIWLDFTDSQFIVVYSHCHYTDDEAVERAEQRLNWGEKCYHCLNNNSHHFVTWAKTGRENPLADIIESLTYQKDNTLKPVLTKVPISNLEEVSEGDHIMTTHIITGTQHFLVDSIDTECNIYTGYTCKSGKVVKEVCTFNAKSTSRIKYDESLSSSEAIANAKRVLEQGEWSDGDKFVTKMKTNKQYSFKEECLFKKEIEFSCTEIAPGIAADEGDHLVVKDKCSNYHSVLVLKHAGGSTFIVTPDLNSDEQYGYLSIDKDTEVYRINYQQSLPVVEVFQRAMSDKGSEVLRECRSELSKFVSWAKTGRKEMIDVEQLKSQMQIAQLCPFQREKILLVNQIKVGDHLIQSCGIPKFHTHWWHFMVTEVSHPPNPCKFKIIHCTNSRISETEETLVPSKDDIYRIIYPESLPVATAIERARSKLATYYFSPHARMSFVRWAKTGSEDGIEVDFLLNNAMPASKSRICTFSQLNPGDYLVEEEDKVTPWHHYLVTEVTSHSTCSAIESWNWKVKDRNLTFNEKHTYSRLNYNDGACISSQKTIADACKLLGEYFFTQNKQQNLVNFLKTGNAVDIKIDSLQDDRTLLRRERVESASELRPGDHIERSTPFISGMYHHMMVTEQPHHDRKCTVIHLTSDAAVKEEEVYIFKEGDNVFRIKYPERCAPEQGIEYLRRSTSLEGYQSDTFVHFHKDEHLIMKATVGEHLRIEVTDLQHRALEHTTTAVIYTGPTLGKINVAAARGAVYGTADGAEALFQLGYRAALSGTAIGIVAGVAVAANLVLEEPFLVRAMYKLHRKKKFDQILQNEFERGVVQESITSASTVVGGIAGAILGQVVMPVPGVGAAVGGAVGGIARQVFGKAEGWAASKLVRDLRPVTLPQLIETSFIANPPPMDEKKKVPATFFERVTHYDTPRSSSLMQPKFRGTVVPLPFTTLENSQDEVYFNKYVDSESDGDRDQRERLHNNMQRLQERDKQELRARRKATLKHCSGSRRKRTNVDLSTHDKDRLLHSQNSKKFVETVDAPLPSVTPTSDLPGSPTYRFTRHHLQNCVGPLATVRLPRSQHKDGATLSQLSTSGRLPQHIAHGVQQELTWMRTGSGVQLLGVHPAQMPQDDDSRSSATNGEADQPTLPDRQQDPELGNSVQDLIQQAFSYTTLSTQQAVASLSTQSGYLSSHAKCTSSHPQLSPQTEFIIDGKGQVVCMDSVNPPSSSLFPHPWPPRQPKLN